MGVKNLKGIVIQGDGTFALPEGKAKTKLFQKVHQQLTGTEMMVKYHNLGTAENVDVLNKLKALPIRNLQQTSDPEIDGITGEKFAERTLLFLRHSPPLAFPLKVQENQRHCAGGVLVYAAQAIP